MDKQKLKKEIIDFIGKEYIEKSRISKDGKGVWLYNKRLKTKPFFFAFNSVAFLYDNDEISKMWRNEYLVEFRGEQNNG